MFRKLGACLILSVVILVFSSQFPVSIAQESRFLSSHFLTKLVYVYLITMAARIKYYFAWTISESVGNASGLGFNGIDKETGKAKWNLLDNVDIFGFEVSSLTKQEV